MSRKESNARAWKKYYAKNKERLKQRSREHYHATKGTLSAVERSRKREYLKKYYRRNKHKWTVYRMDRREQINAEKRKRYREDAATREYYKNQAKNWRKNNPEKAFAQDIAAYGIKSHEFMELLKRQRGLCAICKSKPKRKRLSVDHDHKTKKVRGLLCSGCNFGLGLFRDNPAMLKKAIKYLESARKRKKKANGKSNSRTTTIRRVRA